jgi:hypothetical protein
LNTLTFGAKHPHRSALVDFLDHRQLRAQHRLMTQPLGQHHARDRHAHADASEHRQEKRIVQLRRSLTLLPHQEQHPERHPRRRKQRPPKNARHHQAFGHVHHRVRRSWTAPEGSQPSREP